MRLLIVEDDERSAAYLLRGLKESGHIVDRAEDGDTGLVLAGEGIYDLVILDRRLPGQDGLSLVRQLRAQGHDLPVLMLSAQGGALDRAEGLRAGCDDYLAKPYAFVELLARIEALGRRIEHRPSAATMMVRDLHFTPDSRLARRGAVEVTLQPKEALLLAYLMRHAGQVVTRSMLIEAAWDYDFDPGDAIIDRHIHRLRRKIDPDPVRPLIRTIHGVGYCLDEAGHAEGA
ncbi:response regulator transcription factor [Novosphingobium rosa]|uniref:response regulator transcription factor n=1 Tax=Novosphingobium rosa TaxID=76978 RepID=UPI0008320FF7|nr:response regulator transcription factor [Novosphingobium rosa]